MVQTIATLIDETLMVMGAHLHVRMTDEEKAYLDAHFELIHIKKGEHLVTRGEEVWAQRKIPVVLHFLHHRHKAGGASPLA